MRTRPIVLVSSLLVLAACETDKSVAPPIAPGADASLAAAQGRGPRDKVRVLVRLKSPADQTAVADLARGGGGKVARQFKRYPLIALEVSQSALDGLRRSPHVVSVTEDIPSPPTLNSSLPVINADDVRTLGWTGTGLTVTILDTGIDNAHPFVSGRVVAEACFSSDDGGDEDPLCGDGSTEQTGAGAASINVAACQDGGNNICDHGMHVAGIAAGNGAGVLGAPAAGVAPGASIIAIQVFTRFNNDSDCGGDPGDAPCVRTYASDQIAALEHVLDDLSGSFAITSVNMSLGGGEESSACDGDSRKDAIDDLRAANIATVIASGNDSFLNAVGAPGCISSAITVGSTTNADAVSGFSNRGPLLDVFAPGSSITSSVDGGTFGSKSGTSMATPHVTGAWAVLRQSAPTWTVAQIETLLENTGVAITYSTGGGTQTTPRIDLLAALRGTTQPPVIAADNATVTVNEGSPAGNTGTWSDPDGDPVTLSASIGTVTKNGDGTWSWSFGTKDGPAESQTVRIIAADNRDARDTASFTLTVNNVAPTANAGPDASIISNNLFSFSGTFSDPGVIDFPWNWSIDWGDGSALTTGSTNNQAAAITSSHKYCAAQSYLVKLSVRDKDGGVGFDDLTLTVDYLTVNIDISPAQNPNSINLGKGGFLPVALLSSATFDATKMNPSTVTLGDGAPTDVHVAKRNNALYHADVQDVNGDGKPDVVFKFEVQALMANGDLSLASTKLYLTGYLTDGCTNWRGEAPVRPVP